MIFCNHHISVRMDDRNARLQSVAEDSPPSERLVCSVSRASWEDRNASLQSVALDSPPSERLVCNVNMGKAFP